MQIVYTDKGLSLLSLTLQTTDSFSRKRELPTSASLQMSDRNKGPVLN
jgi:hypothetical protein